MRSKRPYAQTLDFLKEEENEKLSLFERGFNLRLSGLIRVQAVDPNRKTPMQRAIETIRLLPPEVLETLEKELSSEKAKQKTRTNRRKRTSSSVWTGPGPGSRADRQARAAKRNKKRQDD